MNSDKVERLEQDYQNALECGSEDLLEIWQELILAYAESEQAGPDPILDAGSP